MGSHNLEPYIKLIESFLNKQVSALTFERDYLDMFKNDPTMWSEAEYEVLNALFSDIDAFCADPRLRGPADLDEDQLRHQCKVSLEKLLALQHYEP